LAPPFFCDQKTNATPGSLSFFLDFGSLVFANLDLHSLAF